MGDIAIVAHLKNEIASRDKDIHLAATYGKQLFEEKAELCSKYDDLYTQKEVLVQEKHSLQFKLESQIQTVNSLTTELEFQRNRADDLLEKLQVNEKENEAMHKKIQNLSKESQYFKKVHEDLTVEHKSLQDKIAVYEKMLKNVEDQAEKSLCEVDKEDSFDLQAQLNIYMLNNKELQAALSQSQHELEVAKKNEKHMMQIIKDLEETVNDRDSEIRAYIAEEKITKEQMEELQGEIEVLKYDQVDTNRRGNSVFAELDDRRNMVEREYKKLQKKFEHFKKDYDSNKTELDRARGQIAVLQNMASREYQQSFIDTLEDSLSAANRENQELTHKLTKAMRSNVEVGVKDLRGVDNQYDYLRVMLEQLQQKEKELKTEVMNLHMKNMYSNGKLAELQRHHHQVKEQLDSAKQEIAKLNLKMKDLEQGIMQNRCSDKEPRKPNIEILDDFIPLSVRQRTEKTDIADRSLFQPDMTIIPGELELGDDGFRQVKPPRKSNKFILQEFNRVETDDGDSPEKNELKKNEKKWDENEKLQSKRNSGYSKVPSSRRNTDCSQQ